MRSRLVLAGVLCVLLSVALGSWLTDADGAAIDALQRIQNQVAPPESKEAFLVQVDQESLARLDEEGIVFPLPRELYGAVAQVAAWFEADGIAFDIIFSEVGKGEKATLSALGAPGSALSCDSEILTDGDDCRFARRLKAAGIARWAPAGTNDGSIPGPNVLLRDAWTGLGAVHQAPDSDGVFRRYPQWLGPELMSLADVALKTKSTARRAEMVNFAGMDQVPRQSIYNVLRAYREGERLGWTQDGKKAPGFASLLEATKDNAALRDLLPSHKRTWFVGYTAPGLLDLKPNSVSARAPGVMNHIMALESIIGRRMGLDLGVWGAVLGATLMASLAVTVIAAAATPARAMLWAGLSCAGGLACLATLWYVVNIWVSMFSVGLAGASSSAAALGLRFINEWRLSRRLARNLENTMSPAIVAGIRSGEIQVDRYGQKREVTVMFSDLEGFTSISEHLDPVELVEFMNEYLDVVVEPLIEHGAYIDKFIGDAVMAIWNAPVEDPRHAEQALAGVLQMQTAIEAFNRHIKEARPDFPAFAARVGLNTGVAVVGNLGSSRRFNYSALGDTVNLASRLEGMGKAYKVGLLVSESTARASRKSGELLEIDRIVVKGRTQPTRVFTALSNSTSSQVDAYRRALEHYRNGLWRQALEEFEASGLSVGLVMAERCEMALMSGPPKSFRQGVWYHDEK
jgi:adenylate cyclase